MLKSKEILEEIIYFLLDPDQIKGQNRNFKNSKIVPTSLKQTVRKQLPNCIIVFVWSQYDGTNIEQ